jgi:hypothetical protein
MTDSSHDTSPRKVPVFSRAQWCGGEVTYSPATFFKDWAAVSGGKLVALLSMISIILKKYIITSLDGRESLISAALDDDAIAYNTSPIASPSVTCRAKSTATTSK